MSKLLVDGGFASLIIIAVTVLTAVIFGFPDDVFLDGTSTTGATAVAAFVGILFLVLTIAFVVVGYLAGPLKPVFHLVAVAIIGLTAIGSLSAGFDRQSNSLGVPTETADLVTGFSAISSALLATVVWTRARQFRSSFVDVEKPATPQDEVRESNTDLPPFAPPPPESS